MMMMKSVVLALYLCTVVAEGARYGLLRVADAPAPEQSVVKRFAEESSLVAEELDA